MTGPFETEVKIAITDKKAAQDLIEAQGYRVIGPRTLQSDQVFDSPDNALRRSGQLLRLRSEVRTGPARPSKLSETREGSSEPGSVVRASSSEDSGAILTYKGPAVQGIAHKSREEIETSAGDGPTVQRILEKIGFVRTFRYEKYRTTYRAPDQPGLIELDETPIGVFLELEGPAYWIDRAAAALGFATQDYITASYAALYRDHVSAHGGPPDMLF